MSCRLQVESSALARARSPRLRHLLIEAVWRLLRYNPEYRGIAKWRDQFTAVRVTQARKKKIVVAIARQLAVDLWRLGTGRTTPAALGLQIHS